MVTINEKQAYHESSQQIFRQRVQSTSRVFSSSVRWLLTSTKELFPLSLMMLSLSSLTKREKSLLMLILAIQNQFSLTVVLAGTVISPLTNVFERILVLEALMSWQSSSCTKVQTIFLRYLTTTRFAFVYLIDSPIQYLSGLILLRLLSSSILNTSSFQAICWLSSFREKLSNRLKLENEWFWDGSCVFLMISPPREPFKVVFVIQDKESSLDMLDSASAFASFGSSFSGSFDGYRAGSGFSSMFSSLKLFSTFEV